MQQYRLELGSTGFVDVDLTDVTSDWTEFVVARLSDFRSHRPELTDRHGSELVASLDRFYAAIVTLLEGGNLGGIRLVAHKR